MTAVIIQFPRSAPPRLSPLAQAIYDDLLSLIEDGYRNGSLPHSINDGIRCSGGSNPKVVAARQELIDRGVAIKTHDGDCYGPALWLLTKFEDQRLPQPLPVGSV